jgi:hypothetical protein
VIKKNEIMFTGKWMELDIMLNVVSQVSERQRLHVFSHLWKIDPKDNGIHKNKHDHIHIYIENMFVIVELLYGTLGRRERKRE